MAIKSLKELKTLRTSLQDHLNFRENGAETSDVIEVLIGVGTCGIASGAKESYEKLVEIIDKEKLNVKVIGVGCAGFCVVEPTIQLNIPGKEPVMYGNMTEDKMQNLVDVAIKNGNLLNEDYLVKSFKKVVI